jgi:hypothetical protein
VTGCGVGIAVCNLCGIVSMFLLIVLSAHSTSMLFHIALF